MTPEKKLRLSEAPSGTAAIVADVTGEGPFRRRLLDMGFVRGACVRVIKSAPLGDPVEYCLGGTHVTLRKHESEKVIVTVIPNAVCSPRERRRIQWRHGRGGPGPRWLRRGRSE
jgi:Fe2+ transport system protein FeoA